MNHDISVLFQGRAATAKYQRETLSTFGRRHVINFREGHRDDADRRLNLKDRVQIRSEGCLGIVSEWISLRWWCFAGIAVALFEALTDDAF